MKTLDEIIESGLCIGCGLCVPIAGADRLEMVMTDTGVERPRTKAPISDDALRAINAVCPGLIVELEPGAVATDPMWGPIDSIAKGYATDPDVRFEAATGGVLTALGRFMLASGRVERIVHVAPVADDPLNWEARVSTDEAGLRSGTSSRYGPAAPLTGLMELLDFGTPLAVIAKPCDIAAVRNLARIDARVGELIRYVLALVCAGASKLSKTWGLLDEFEVRPEEVDSLRYRGLGNPGPTRVTTHDGRAFETTYLAMWEEEGTWDLQWRCKVCPDGMGEVADVVALDCWPGGAPTGEDEGFNGIIARTEAGAELLAAAVTAGAVTITENDLPVAVLENWQPHQSRRKRAVKTRLGAMADRGLPVLAAPGLRLDAADSELTDEQRHAEYQGTVERLQRGDNRDPIPE